MPKKRRGSILQSGREISRQELDEIQETAGVFLRLSRTKLAGTICEHLGWMTAPGGYKIDACMKLLEKLESKEFLELPEKRQKSQGRQHKKSQGRQHIALTSKTEVQADIVGNLGDLGLVNVEVVKDKKLTGLWNEYVSRYHYLGYKKPFGYVLRYFIVSERGLLGCLMFRASAVRDRWIGWTQRLKNLAWVINNSRFLIFPWVQVKNLASHVLGRFVRCIKEDWQERWGYSPVLAETFVDPHYEGISYKAANWQYLGMTMGEGLVRKRRTYTTTPKKIFVKPLVKDWRSLLCSEQLEGRVDK